MIRENNQKWPGDIPARGSVQWPYRDQLDDRERILLESRSILEMFNSLGTIEGDPEEVLGYGEYLMHDWDHLRNLPFNCGRPSLQSEHKRLLQIDESYRAAIRWCGPPPESACIVRILDFMRN